MTMTEQTAIRLSEELIERIDRFRKDKEKENPGLEISRSEAIRMLLTKELDFQEKGYVLEVIGTEKVLEDLQRRVDELNRTPESPNEPVIVPPNLKKQQ